MAPTFCAMTAIGVRRADRNGPTHTANPSLHNRKFFATSLRALVLSVAATAVRSLDSARYAGFALAPSLRATGPSPFRLCQSHAGWGCAISGIAGGRTSPSHAVRMQLGAEPTPPNLPTNELDWKGLDQLGADWIRYGPTEDREGPEDEFDVESLPAPRWYIVQCNPGLEDSVRATLMAKISNSMRLKQTIREVLVPCTVVTKLGVGGKAVMKLDKLFPGYVFVNMRMDKDTWYTIKNSQHVLNFVGHDRARRNAGGGIAAGRGHVVPTPLTRAEEKRIFDRIAKEGVEEEPSKFEVGTRVRITQGIFIGNEGKIIQADLGQNRFLVRMDLFSKETPTEFSPSQMELVEEELSMGPEVDEGVEQEVMSELREAWDEQNQVNPFKPKED